MGRWLQSNAQSWFRQRLSPGDARCVAAYLQLINSSYRHSRPGSMILNNPR